MNKENSLKIFYAVSLAFVFFICGFASSCSARPKGDAGTKIVRAGPEIVLDLHEESDVVCVAISVGAGSVFETPSLRGISHFIEHMVFNGSERYTRDEISGWVEDVGGFLNAFTRKEKTIYFLLVRRALAEEGLEILSQMLLHSIFPSKEIVKERKIVLEEIRRTLDSPAQARGRLIDHYLYRGSRLTAPVLGYPATLDEMTRENLMSYYKRFYKPSNMKIFVMGGFDGESICRWINDYFPSDVSEATERCGSHYKGESGNNSAFPGPLDCTPRWSNRITVRNIAGISAGFDILVRIPGDIEGRHLARAAIMADLLAGDNSPLAGRFETMGIHNPVVSLEAHTEFAALRFHFPSPNGSELEYSDIPMLLEELSSWRPGAELVESSRISYLSSDAFDREKFHYYIMLNGEMMSLLGSGYMRDFIKGISEVGGKEIERLLRQTFKDIEYNACLVSDEPRRFEGLLKENRGAAKTLSNGCVVSSGQKKGSDIAALNILIKGRNCLETDFTPGSSIVLHKILEMSVGGGELSERLESLGARVEWGDNPYIPMDDYRLNPSFSFIRLEAPAAGFKEAAGILIDYMLNASFTQADFRSVQKQLTMELAIRSGSPVFELKDIFYRRLFGKHPFGRSLFPDGQYWSKMSPERLRDYRNNYFTGSRIVATLVSGELAGESLGVLSDLFSLFPAGDGYLKSGELNETGEPLPLNSVCPNFPDSSLKGQYEFSSPGSGAYLMAGFAAPVCDSEETAAILVTSEIVNSRMQREIRERLGLAYSTGCSVKRLKGGLVTAAYVGTRNKNVERVRKELKGQIEKIVSERPDENEIITAANKITSKIVRRELSSINRAFSYGENLFLLGGDRITEDISEVELNGVNRVIDRYFKTGNMLYIDLLPSADGRQVKGIKDADMKMR